ncbi:hypothetical protein SH584_04360 [Sphingomonas sp. LY29]|uniref:ArnT family glycosyltransferase n=1 Tax=Sphingomonas sp. LY29 TaxID=3095341 RepID=UPI002D787DD4|nr:hypothetical protein [Sphingomonas sp. LY29]WRP26672.1 hypothetical protein SH584_04360 [Sphingomonas sp. LY29]
MKMWGRTSILVLALGIALAMRLVTLWLVSGTEPVGDAENYLRMAHSIIAGDGLAVRGSTDPIVLPTASFPPALPLLLAAVGSIVPLTALTLTALNSVIDLCAAVLLGRLVTQWGRPDLSVLVGAFYLLWPSIALMAPFAYKEGLVIALMLATIVAFQTGAKANQWKWSIIAGACAGLTILAQPAIAPFFVLAFLVLLPTFQSKTHWLRASVMAAVVAGLTMSPWWLRNALVFDRFIPITTSSGLALWVGALPGGGMKWQMPPAAFYVGGELAGAKEASDAAWRIIRSDPVGYVVRCLAKLPKSLILSNWAVDQIVFAPGQHRMSHPSLLRATPTYAEVVAFICAAVAMIRFPRSTNTRMILAGVAHILLFCIWFEFSQRHRLFLTPFLLIACVTLLVGTKRTVEGA